MPSPTSSAIDAVAPATGAAASQTPAFSPLYQQIKGLILHSLQHGEWKPGEAIPSEMELAARFRVSQGTVRKAIDELAADNLLTRRQGKGTFVATHAEHQVQYRFLKLLPDGGDARGEFIAMLQRRLGVEPPPPSCPGCPSPPRDENFNQAVRRPSPYLPGIVYTNISTRDDEVVTPYTLGQLPGPPGTEVTDIVVQRGCPADHSDHASITSNRRSAAMVLNALDPAHQRPVPCVPVAPFTGG